MTMRKRQPRCRSPKGCWPYSGFDFSHLASWIRGATVLGAAVCSRALLLLSICSFLTTSALKGQTSSSSQESQPALAAQAVQAQQGGDYRTAARIYEEMLKENPHSAELRSNLGVMHHLLGDYPDAMRDFHAALQEQPRLFVPNLFMGLDLVQTGQPRKVICYLATAHKLRPDDPNPVLGLGGADKASGDLLKARKFYEEAARLNPQIRVPGSAWV
jgi:tetratricopeptide (TPR) repeat protein